MKRRITIPSKTCCYHVMSRTVHGERWFNGHEKSALRSIIWRAGYFSGVRVLTYCIMVNHFHLLIEVPPEAKREQLSNAELAKRYRVLCGNRPGNRCAQLTPEQVEAIFDAGGAPAVELRERLLLRMHDLSAFMETIKSRFTRWYNHQHDTFGTLWASRFKSVLLENTSETLKAVAAYIDLNPVRAGLVEDPAKYPYSGLGDAHLKYAPAREGLEAVVDYGFESRRDAYERYRVYVYSVGSVPGGSDKSGFIPQAIVKQVWAELDAAGKQRPSPFDALLSKRFADAVRAAFVVGSAAFIEANGAFIQKLLGSKKTPRPKQLIAEGGDMAYLNQKI